MPKNSPTCSMSQCTADARAAFSGARDVDSRPSDFVLRSCDGVDLHVHKTMLSFSSDFFDGMFAIPLDQDFVQRDGKPVLTLPEPSAVLYPLLCLAYPAQPSTQSPLAPSDIDGIASVYETAHKYQFTDVQRLIKRMLFDPILLDAHPHRLFAIACLRDLPDLARAAALRTLALPVCPATPAFPEMQRLMWTDAHRLHEFHHLCGAHAHKVAETTARARPAVAIALGRAYYAGREHEDPGFLVRDEYTGERFVWWTHPNGAHSAQCQVARTQPQYGSIAPAQWFQGHVAQLAGRLRRKPVRQTVEAEALNISSSARAIIETCAACAVHAETDLGTFGRQLAWYIETSNNRLAANI
ncbi:hypothetical protein B0H15DRAFT_988358 [Mycena belliarum]|uniref:BTB domain-containing protein n=1 Tax=Mycena belliarum TaxID=1033014 RepID=A0AAD6XQF5_9AGAR|nr:hypothetical protein B0H15DRAFT_988358 [Mycena belliae]